MLNDPKCLKKYYIGCWILNDLKMFERKKHCWQTNVLKFFQRKIAVLLKLKLKQ